MTDPWRDVRASEEELLRDPEILREAARYEAVAKKLSNQSLVALHIVARREIERRATKIPTGRIGR